MAWLTLPVAPPARRYGLALLASLLIALAVVSKTWWLGPLGLALLGYAALRQPALWATALLFALPFYFSQTLPILPNRATNLIDIGVLGGVVVVMGSRLLTGRTDLYRSFPTLAWMALLTGWAMISTAAAHHGDVALREWRTVFLAALLFALLLAACRDDPRAPWLLVGGWIAGAVVVAGIGLMQFVTNVSLIEAEGVRRVLSLYGSPNNLALYLERSLMPALALLLLLPNGRWRLLAGFAAAIIGAALLLTFSKGALLLGLPVGLLTLWGGGMYILRRQGCIDAPALVARRRRRRCGSRAAALPRHRAFSAALRLQHRHRLYPPATLAQCMADGARPSGIRCRPRQLPLLLPQPLPLARCVARTQPQPSAHLAAGLVDTSRRGGYADWVRLVGHEHPSHSGDVYTSLRPGVAPRRRCGWVSWLRPALRSATG